MTTCAEYLTNLSKYSRKYHRKQYRQRHIRFIKWVKEKVRLYQKQHNGIDPRGVIPRNTYYCYKLASIENRGSELAPIIHTVPCEHWYSIPIPKEELDDHVGIVAVDQDYIGGCRLLGITDDKEGWGLLWNQCKECGLYEDYKPSLGERV